MTQFILLYLLLGVVYMFARMPESLGQILGGLSVLVSWPLWAVFAFANWFSRKVSS